MSRPEIIKVQRQYINTVISIRDKVLQGTFVNENYLTQFESVNIQNPVKRFFLYKSKSNITKEWKEVDCDVSLAAIVTYGMMHNWLGIKYNVPWNVKLQTRSASKYKLISEKGNYYLGDTMTSAWTFFKNYLYLLWKSENVSITYKNLFEEFEDKNGRKQKKLTIPKGEDKPSYKKLFDYLADKIIYDENFLNIIDSEISEEAKNFLDNYLKAGNFLMVPQNFNAERCGFQAKLDTVDRMLWKIYQYFNEDKTEYLHQLFVNAKAKEKSVKIFKSWMAEAGINSWNEFIEDNLLESFVDMVSEEKIPISMKTGFGIENDIDDYNPMPKTLNEFEMFFGNLNQRIIKRSRLVYEKCLENKEYRVDYLRKARIEKFRKIL